VAESLEARALLSVTPAMVADINPGAPSSNASQLVAIGSTTYFTANDGVHGQELWKSDGTAAGTMLVKDINPGSAGSAGPYSSNLTNVNGTLFFTASDGVHGDELWTSDGTAAGTTMVADINPGGSGSYAQSLTNANGTLFFAANDGLNGRELWKSEGTPAHATIVADINPYAGSYASNLTDVNGTLFFTADDGVSGNELWKSDSAGTTRVGDIFPGGEFDYWGTYSINSSNPSDLTNVNGTLFFSADDGTVGRELWKSDAAGTTLVKDIFPGLHTYYGYYVTFTAPNNSNPGNLTNVNGTLFFTAADGVHGNGLWKSDGTAAGTTMVNAINPDDLTNVNGTLFFQATDGTHGYELWKSDGTAAGTVMVADINPGSASSYPFKQANANSILFFAADDGIHGAELWTFPAVSGTPVPSLDVNGFPTSTTAGAAGTFTVTARNANGTTNAGYTGTVKFSTTDLQATIVNPTTASAVALQGFTYTFTAADAGVHTFSATLKTAGTQSLTATDIQTPAETSTEGRILVRSAAVSTMTVTGFPSATTAGVGNNVTVTLKDLYGNIASGYTGTVHFTSSDAKAVLPANYTFTTADAGKHDFRVTLRTAGTRSITAADIATASLIGMEGNITVIPASARQFLISAPSSINRSVAFSLTLTINDAYGNVVTGYTGTVHFTSSDNTALLPANYTFTAADMGVHTFTGLVLRKRTKQTITITDTQNGSLFAIVTERVR